jgi:hypothetical protein
MTTAPQATPMNLTGHSSNPGMPATAPLHYTSTMVLYSAIDRVAAVVDGAPAGPSGRLFVVEPGRPTKVPYEAGRFILEHMAYTGVVRVEEVTTYDADGNETGIQYDVESAKADSADKSAASDEVRFRQYVSDCMEDYIARKDGKSKVPPPPSEAILRIIERRGYKLEDYGIKPLGYKDPNAEKQQKLEAENISLKSQFDALQAQFTAMLNKQNATNNDGTVEATDANSADVPNVPATGRNRRRQ